MILSGEKILELVEKEQLIDGFSIGSLCGAGYDLRAGRFYRIKGSAHLGADSRILPEVDEMRVDELVIKPGEYILIETMEKIKMPGNLMARILSRSTLFRSGCFLLTAVVDPGYCGTLTMGLKNLSDIEFRLGRGARMGQIVFEEVVGNASLYAGRYQGGKVI